MHPNPKNLLAKYKKHTVSTQTRTADTDIKEKAGTHTLSVIRN